MKNGTLLTLGAVGVVAAMGAANKAGLYGSHNENEGGSFATRLTEVGFKKVRANEEESRGMYHDPVVIKVDGKRIVTPAGTEDDMDVYRYGDDLLVVTINHRRSTYGAVLYTQDDDGAWVEDQDIFLQNDWEAEETLGENHQNLKNRTIANRLLAVFPGSFMGKPAALDR